MKLSDDLRRSVINAAITGTLLQQRSNENAHEEMQKFNIKESRIDDDLDIPENWATVQLSELVIKEIKRGKTPKYVDESKVLAFAQKCNLKHGGISIEKAKFFDEAKAAKYSEEEFLHDHDIVVNSTGGGTLGRVGLFHSNILPTGTKIIPDSHVTTIRINPIFDYQYFYLFLKFYQRWLETQGVGSTNQTELKPDVLKKMIIFVPPLAEQHRIVEKVDMLMAEIDELEKKENELEKLKKEFPEDMKASLLQAAMEGKLTKQMKEDGNMKIKYRSFTKNDFSNSDVPFDIPDNWRWFRHNALLNIVGGSQPPKSHFSNVMKPGYIRLYQTRDYGDKPVPVYINKSEAKKTTNNGDILLARYGGSLGKVFKAKEGAYNVAMAKIVKIHNEVEIDNNFLYYYYMSPIYQNFIKKQSNGRSAQGGFNKKDLDELFFPLPPLAEQHRIVEKLDVLLPLCEELKEDEDHG